ncbi:MAG: hypothetical protein GY751_25770 [Bacteroidetes bacterium]|nr:hypothetical protein [Bacteroidota bacterium]
MQRAVAVKENLFWTLLLKIIPKLQKQLEQARDEFMVYKNKSMVGEQKLRRRL